MMRKLLPVLAILAVLGCSREAGVLPADEMETVRAAAQDMADATLAGDYETVISWTNPKAIAAFGSEELAMAAYQRSYAKLEEQGLSIVSIDVQQPSPLTRTDEERIVLVPVLMTIDMPDSVVTANSFMLASAADGSSDWRFIDSSGIPDRAALESYYPGFPDDVSLPEPSTTAEMK